MGVVRTAPDALELTWLDGHLLGEGEERLFRPDSWPMRAGDSFVLDGMQARILAVDDTGPTRVSFHFDRPLDDPNTRVMAWTDGALRRVALPEVGAALVLPHAPWGW